ncbi:MAG TPA: 3-methyl-2-oxobutanoate hydroxymethyltransferase [Kiritimatiellia bacterium]|jgi:3-methyl-2-oxobutanoate hydroxymethyltransferase|nr:3-methyl-2-oxobutanoate hydroxymethyltransferase [Kiritimatiellia bacterium]OQC60579.1 MAG: 3-methyl-2-oxobutanoate hydroxymethyltransferase [Verrucomicrobia bacterium ADurb.Bin018]MBP9572018.1 3-methyl-2-oxobutanoate hydroxymethyltransferase [Kiritimatiellia bacterium]HOE01242.1 3-methyl-2-oxobutanoate hydroxymethyltransferase [Kiritimatiellia bacterium]HOE36420.1 3-methyl-2-oxobutanoate hydroxymethyltransferase [Kiritimatiellia bacterium]
MRLTPRSITAMKGREKIAALTAYDYRTAQLLDAAGIPLLLVGDSLGTTLLGYENTLPVTLLDMLRHTAAVVRGVKNAVVVVDMPFMTYQASIEQALRNCGRAIQKTGCHAVKIEGGEFRAPTVAALVQNGIPVLGHIGLTPQSVQTLGLRVQGRGTEAARQLVADAQAIAAAGAFAIVLEAVPSALGAEVTAAVPVPVIGIGAGPGCDGQILVINDLLGLSGDFKPKFVKQYANLGAQISAAASAYKSEVAGAVFPGPEHGYD